MSATQWTDGFGNTGELVEQTTTAPSTQSLIYPCGDPWPYWPTVQPCYQPITTGYIHVTQTEPPRECSGDVHVFPCPHCDKCKCGGATKIKAKAKSRRR